MPTYEYQCAACDHRFEEFQSITAKPLKKCPACKKSKVNRLLGTGAGMIFKGSGFYITDYRSEGYKSAAKAETGTSGSSPAGSSGAAAAAPSGKSDAKASSAPAPAPASAAPAAPAPAAKKSAS